MIITKTQGGFSAKFAFELKDAFKTVFPTAKWDQDSRAWKVGVRSEKRLLQWAEEIKPAEGALAEAEAVTLTGKKLDDVRELIKTVKETAENLARQNGGLAAMCQTLAEVNDELTAAKAVKEAEAKRIIQQRAEISEALSGIVSIERMKQLASIMSKNHTPANGRMKGIFIDAQDEALAMHRKMKVAGWRCETLVTLINANINRPDRDGVGNIPVSDWYDIKKIEKPKED